MANNAELIKQCEERAQQWLTPAFDEETRKEVKAMLDAEDKSALVDAFYQNLEFGTGGLRGIMGAGTNRMNKYIVGMATQGFANYILKAFPGEENLSVVVGHDCRNNSRLFAETVAAFLVANVLFSAILGVVGASCLWSIGELFEQRQRCEKGWFPKNPKRIGTGYYRDEAK